MKQTGWAIQITRCAYLDDPQDKTTEHYAVNLAMPWSADDTADSLVDGKGPQTPVLAPVSKELLPWHWTGTQWHVFARSGLCTLGGGWTLEVRFQRRPAETGDGLRVAKACNRADRQRDS